MLSIDDLVNKVAKNGPSRVYARCGCGCGELVGRSPSEQGCPAPDVIFIRNDGWSLGAPTEFIAEAEQMWKDSWAAVMHVGSRVVKTYFQWEKSGFDSA